MFSAYSLKNSQNVLIQSFQQHKECFFSIPSNVQIVDIEYPQGICSTIFVAQEFFGLFAHPSTFLIKDSIAA